MVEISKALDLSYEQLKLKVAFALAKKYGYSAEEIFDLGSLSDEIALTREAISEKLKRQQISMDEFLLITSICRAEAANRTSKICIYNALRQLE